MPHFTAAIKTVLDAVAAAVVIFQENKVIFSNTAAQWLFSYTAAEMQGMTLNALTHPDSYHLLQDWDVASQPLRGVEIKLQAANGQVLTAEFSASLTEFDERPAWLATLVDVSQRWQAEAKLRESEFQYRLIAEYNQDVVSLTDSDGWIIYTTPSVKAITGYTAEERLQNPAWTLLHPDDSSTMQALQTQMKQTHEPIRYEYRIMTKSGEVKWLESITRVIRDNQFAFVDAITVSRDITHRKKIEEALYKSQHFLRDIGHLAKIGGWEFDLLTQQVRWTEETYRIHELPLHFEPTYQNILTFYTPESAQILEQAVRNALETGEAYDLELTLITARGKEIQVRAIGSARSRDGRVIKMIGALQDITEKKQAEETLRQSEGRLRSLLETQSAYMIRTDLNGNFTYVSPAWLKKFGGTSEQMLGTSSLGTVYPADHEKLFIAVFQSIENPNQPIQVTLRKPTPDGGLIWTLWEFVGLQNSEGVVNEIQCVGFDITERKQAEESLRRSEQFYRALFEQTNDAVFLIDLEGKFFNVNTQAQKMHGYAREEMIGMPYGDTVAQNEYLESMAILKRLIAGEKMPVYERTLRRKDGRTFVTEVNVQIIYDTEDNSKPLYIQSVVRDITERKRAEEALKAERNLLVTLMENIPDKIYFKDTASRFTRVNRSQARMLGRNSPDEVLGKTDSDFQQLDLASIFYNEEQHLFATGEPIIDRIEYNPLPDGTPRWFSATKMPIKDEQDGVIGLVGISRNITERKLAEDAMRESEQRYRLLAENTSDFVTLQDTRGALLYASPSFERLLGHTFEDLKSPDRGQIVDPEFHPVILHASERVLKGETVSRLEYRAYKKTGEAVWLEANVVPIWNDEGQVYQLLSSTRDVTVNKRMQQSLLESSWRFRALIENSYDLILLVDIAGNITYISPSSIRITGYPDTAFVGDVASQQLANLVHPDDLLIMSDFFNLLISQPAITRVMTCRLLHAKGHWVWLQGVGTNLLAQSGIEAVVINARDISESIRAFESEREQRRFAETLLDSLAILNSTLDFDEVLENLLNNIERIIPHEYANIALVDKAFMRVVGVHGYTPEQASLVSGSRYPVLKTPNLRHMLETHQPLLIPNTAEYAGWQPILLAFEIQSYLGVPILLNENVIGFINLESKQANFFTEHEAERLKVFANQAAIAINNARAYEQAQELAIVRERQRLARDLHDAVSQTLFSANVIAETLPLLFDVDRDEVKAGLGQLARLTKGALSEMRTLLVELRPSALLETDLTVLLTHLVNGFSNRTQARVEFFVDGSEHSMPADTRVCFYRIAQEALNNVIKHARATSIRLTLQFGTNQIRLDVLDNGIGFDPNTVSSANLGLRIMRERTEGAQITLKIKSEAGHGTHISSIWTRQYNND